MGTSTYVYILSTGWAESGGFPKASWPAKLMKMMSSGFHEKANLKTENNNVDRDWIVHPISVSGLHMHPTHALAYTWTVHTRLSNQNTLAVHTGLREVFQSLPYVCEHLAFCYPFVLFSDITGTDHLKTFNREGEGERDLLNFERRAHLSLQTHPAVLLRI